MEAARELEHLQPRGAAHGDRGRSVDLGREPRVREIRPRVGEQQRSARFRVRVGPRGLGSRRDRDTRDPRHLGEVPVVGRLDAGVHHRPGRRRGEQIARRLEKRAGDRRIDEHREAGVRAELTRPQGDRGGEAPGDRLAAVLESARQQKNGIGRAHLGEHRDRLRPQRRRVVERPPGDERSGERGRSNRGVCHERDPDFGRAPVNHREDAFGHSGLAPRRADGRSRELRSPRMGGVSLDHDGAAGRQRRDRIAACDRKSEREVRRAEDRHGAGRHEHAANVGPGLGLAVGERSVDARADPGPLFDQLGEEQDLPDGPGALALEARRRKARLGAGAREKPVAERDRLLGDRPQESGAARRGKRRVGLEGALGGARRRIDVARGRLEELALEDLPRRRILHLEDGLPPRGRARLRRCGAHGFWADACDGPPAASRRFRSAATSDSDRWPAGSASANRCASSSVWRAAAVSPRPS